jgi:hypothetical protein
MRSPVVLAGVVLTSLLSVAALPAVSLFSVFFFSLIFRFRFIVVIVAFLPSPRKNVTDRLLPI